MSFTAPDVALLLLGALLGGLVNGMTGFGTGLTAMPIWIHIMPPPMAAAMAAAGGLSGQLQTLHLIWHAIEWRRVGPFILAGLIGVPIGTWVLPLVNLRQFKLVIGCVLVIYCGFQLSADRLARTGVSARGGRSADVVVGFGGGLMSGLVGLSGPPLIVWATFKPWSRDEKRALFQTFNSAILLATLVSSAAAGLLPASFWIAALLMVPASFVGVRLGAAVYRRLDDRRFDRVIVSLLLVAGVSLILASW